MTGTAVFPSHKDHDKARLVSNYYTSKNSHPEAIVYCSNTYDVQNAVKWALCKKIPVKIRSNGHNHEGFSTGPGLLAERLGCVKQKYDPTNLFRFDQSIPAAHKCNNGNFTP